MTSSGGRSTGVPQAGQRSGIRHGAERVSGSTPSSSGRTTCGITSPARITSTRSPSRMSFCAISSSLCSVAALTVTPVICTGSSDGPGIERAGAAHVDLDARCSRVTATSGANFRAIAQRGSRPPTTPSSPWSRSRSTLTTTPSAWNGRWGSRCSKRGDLLLHLRQRVEALAVRLHLEAPGVEQVEHLRVGARRERALDRLDREGEHPQPALAGERGVELAEPAGGGVARVGEERLALLLALPR